MKLKSKERRCAMAQLLTSEKKAIPGAELAKIYGVSRQIIVHDIDVLKSEGYDIASTHFGYLLKGSPLLKKEFKVFHTTDKTEEELDVIVSLGGIVSDVFIEHKAYGKLTAPLNVFAKKQVKEFVDGIKNKDYTELMQLTDGVHFHTVRAKTEAELDAIEKALTEKGFIIK
jgi:transcriptional regulator of NAD metabolism